LTCDVTANFLKREKEVEFERDDDSLTTIMKLMVIQMKTRIKGRMVMAISHIHTVNQMMVNHMVHRMFHFVV